MPRKLLVENLCSRCQRTWLDPYTEGQELAVGNKLALSLTLGKDVMQVAFDPLCSSCAKTVKAYVESIGKQLQKKSPGREAKKKEEPVAPPPPAKAAATPPAPPPPAPAHTSSAGKPAALNQSKPQSARG